MYVLIYYFFIQLTRSNRMFWKQDIASTICIIYHMSDGNLTMQLNINNYLMMLYRFRHMVMMQFLSHKRCLQDKET